MADKKKQGEAKAPVVTQQPTPRYVWAITITITLLAAFWFLLPYLSIGILGLLLAFVFYPMYQFFLRKTKSPGWATTITTFMSVLIVAIPLIVVLWLAFNQTVTLVNDVANNGVISGDTNLEDTVLDISNQLNDTAESVLGIKDLISTDDIQQFLSTTLPAVISGAGSLLIGLVSGIPSFFTLLIIYFFIFTAGLLYGERIGRLIHNLSPFDNKTTKLYSDRAGAMAKAMIKGQFLIALAQGIVSAAALALVGFSEFFVFFAVIFTFMSFIPLGAGIITIPLGILLIIGGNISGGLIVLANHFIVVTNIDNYIRPKVVPDDARLPAVLTILGAFAGVAYFGLIGVIYGPIIMILITTTIESYLDYKKRAGLISET